MHIGIRIQLFAYMAMLSSNDWIAYHLHAPAINVSSETDVGDAD